LIEKEFERDIPIGRPIANSTAYIYDKNRRLAPIGVMGELVVGGDGVALGYLNNPELTAEKFIFFPNFLTSSLPNFPLYCTGDLARWLPDGPPAGGASGRVIEFIGRIDQQVKIRGFRIELGEIENRLLKHPGIKGVVVSVQEEEKGDKYLCAYVVSDGENVISQLREYLAGELPEYMIPSYFVRLKKIPLTPNGKVDRKALQLPKPGLNAGESYVAPGDEVEKKLVGLWSEILGLQTGIGIDDNFFQLGGHSLKATILVSKIHRVFDVKIPLREIFKNPRIRELARYIKNASQWEYKQVEPVEKKEYYVLSSAQKRLYFLWEMDKDGTAYNIPSIMIMEGIVDKDKLVRTIAKIILRHESLRTSIDVIEEKPVQRIHEQVEFEIEYKDLATDEHGQTRTLLINFIRPFDLLCAPLLRVGLIRLAEEKHLFLVDMHHIISDGMSSQVLVQDFSALYAGQELPEIKVRYKDYAEWQNREKVSKMILEQGEYWKKQFAGEIPVLELPADYERPAVQDFEGNSIHFEVNAGGLNALAQETGSTLYMVLSALYAILLAKLSGREDIVIGSPVFGRRHADIEKIIGMFVNTLALRYYPAGEKRFTDFLGEVKEIALKGFENQEYQYEDLVEQVAVNRDTGRNPLFDTMLVLQNTGSQKIKIPGLELVPYEYEHKISKFDLTLIAAEVDEKLQFTFEYSTKLFKPETVERFIVYFKNIIQGVIENPRQKISGFEIITQEEKRPRALAKPGLKAGESDTADTAYTAPGNEIEKKLVKIWHSILNRASDPDVRIGIADNFFRLGGHSLSAVGLISLIHKEFDVKVPLAAFFKKPTIRGLAENITGMAKDIYTAIEPVEKKEFYTTSAAQKRLYFINRMFPEDINYNIYHVFIIEGKPGKEKIANIFQRLIERHEAFRTAFKWVDNRVVQFIYDRVDFAVDYFQADESDTAAIIRRFIRPFDLDRAPFLRVGWVDIGENKDLFIIDMHHIISDLVSSNILVEEFLGLYGEKELLPLRLQYKDYAAWETRFFESETYRKQGQYWLDSLSGRLPALDLPTDYPRPAQTGFKGKTITLKLPDELCLGIKDIMSKYETTPYMTLLAFFIILLGKYTGQTDMIIGSPSAGRPHAGLEHIIGFFVNILPMRFSIEPTLSFAEFLAGIRRHVIRAFENRMFQFDELIRSLDIKREEGRNPLYDVVFAVLSGEPARVGDDTGIRFQNLEYDDETTQSDLRLGVGVSAHSFSLRFTYAVPLFKPESAQQMLNSYLEIIKQVLADDRITIENIRITHMTTTTKSKAREKNIDFNF
ncbi:MAG TPA: condensation domain-containing protein, partial [Candidatus Deferrimicrobium sp.]|nr:condensation domain-containing protein [Candidatus Deferrimicrobium sp.]